MAFQADPNARVFQRSWFPLVPMPEMFMVESEHEAALRLFVTGQAYEREQVMVPPSGDAVAEVRSPVPGCNCNRCVAFRTNDDEASRRHNQGKRVRLPPAYTSTFLRESTSWEQDRRQAMRGTGRCDCNVCQHRGVSQYLDRRSEQFWGGMPTFRRADTATIIRFSPDAPTYNSVTPYKTKTSHVCNGCTWFLGDDSFNREAKPICMANNVAFGAVDAPNTCTEFEPPKPKEKT
ncbi:MAG: hypothetical protein RBJ76_13155 [Stenomitos frigidus ULC029]